MIPRTINLNPISKHIYNLNTSLVCRYYISNIITGHSFFAHKLYIRLLNFHGFGNVVAINRRCSLTIYVLECQTKFLNSYLDKYDNIHKKTELNNCNSKKIFINNTYTLNLLIDIIFLEPWLKSTFVRSSASL